MAGKDEHVKLVYPGPGQTSYSSFLHLDEILASQELSTGVHDELLFVVIHQAAELWMKLQIAELRKARDDLFAERFLPAVKTMTRVQRIQAHLAHSWDVLATMTPTDYLEFRDKLGRSSGLQSYQYRVIEFLLGAKDRETLARHHEYPAHHAAVEQALNEPSVYDAAIACLAKAGLPIDEAHLTRDVTEGYFSNSSVKEAWKTVYRNTDKYPELYKLGEDLIAVDDQFNTWRYRHMKTVWRIIGFKTGTAGTAGVNYLKQVIDRPFFPELWELRTEL